MILRYRWLKILGIFAIVIVAFISIKTVYRATTFKPQSIFEVPFRQRSLSKFDEDVRVTVAVLSAQESRKIFGVNLAGKGIARLGKSREPWWHHTLLAVVLRTWPGLFLTPRKRLCISFQIDPFDKPQIRWTIQSFEFQEPDRTACRCFRFPIC